jgi:hypothetical protein
MYDELFKLCGYSEEEIKEERGRIEKAFQILGIEKKDIKGAERRITENFDIKLEGVRKLLGVWMKELICLVLAREENKYVIYGDWPLPGTILMAAMKASPSNDVYVGMPGQVLNLTVGTIFDALSPLLEAGEENGLPPGSAHCAIWQTHIGAIVKGIIPLPDLIISPGWYCDQPAEADQLLHELYGIPVVYCDGCVDSSREEWTEISERRIRYFGGQIRKTVQEIEKVTGYEVTEEMQRAAMLDRAKFWLNFNPLVELAGKVPQPISQADIGLAYFMANTVLEEQEKANRAVITLYKEVSKRVKQGQGIVAKDAPRVYF